MKKHTLKSVFTCFLLAAVLLIACREEFNPNIDATDTNLLVVEGFISIDGQLSEIKLTRTSNLDETGFRMVTGSLIELRGERTGFWQFSENVAGTYSLSAILPAGQKYILRIRLNNNDEYVSDMMQPLIAPEIDELTWRKSDSGVSIRASTQGSEDSQYFLWQYEEDWIYRSAIGTAYRYDNDIKAMVEVTPLNDVSRCWNENRVQRIVIENAARFSGNTISDKEVNLIPNFSEKLGVRYSILVRQMAIDRKAFEFWEIMRKNTEDIGGIFSPLPSLIGGNIKKVGDENISAIGYISMGVIADKRIYINSADVAPWPVRIPEYFGCVARPDTIRQRDYEEIFSAGDPMPVEPIFGGTSPFPTAFRAASKFCVDCRERGGTIIRPDFWEN